LKAQQYTPQQRTDAVMELLEILAEEVDYFRTAPLDEKKILADRLQKE
jgi:hypothetical protein